MTNNDELLDGVLFRFWIRAGSYPGGWPTDCIKAISKCTTESQYRISLIALANSKGVNLPNPDFADDQAAEIKRLRNALASERDKYEALVVVVKGYQNMPGFSVHPMVAAQMQSRAKP